MSRFAWSPSGAFAVADGNELVAWDPNIDAPTWRRALSLPILALGASSALVASLEQGGAITLWNGRDGAPAGGATVLGASTLAMGASAACAVATPDRIEVLDSLGRRSLPVASATALRFSRDDAKLGVGLADGRFVSFDVRTGAALVQAALPGGQRVTAVVERAPGAEWLATSGDTVHAIGPSGKVQRVTGASGTQLLDVCANERGTLFGVQLGERLAIVLGWPPGTTGASVRYPERKIEGIALGAGGFWVGLDQGDGNKVDLRGGGLYRTDPHEGRPLNRWLVHRGHEASVIVPNL